MYTNFGNRHNERTYNEFLQKAIFRFLQISKKLKRLG